MLIAKTADDGSGFVANQAQGIGLLHQAMPCALGAELVRHAAQTSTLSGIYLHVLQQAQRPVPQPVSVSAAMGVLVLDWSRAGFPGLRQTAVVTCDIQITVQDVMARLGLSTSNMFLSWMPDGIPLSLSTRVCLGPFLFVCRVGGLLGGMLPKRASDRDGMLVGWLERYLVACYFSLSAVGCLILLLRGSIA
jgi:hypothetical protein